ncbi:uncharacterized protein LOC114885438 [Monodon monoceros]|uniref:uncharacterized protein LOC114885438 n=1 Tax=Monodon monoceros TaxID=40151 RepID=UPI0010F6B53F|nr:uncharacterized protein LOC114885438 [Monodon monoceros]
MCGWGLAAHQKEGERFCAFSVKMEHLLCAPERDQLKASGAGRQELKATGRWVARGRCAPDLSSLSPFLVSSLYFLLKKQQKDGGKKTTRTKRKKPSTKPTMDSISSLFFFSFFFLFLPMARRWDALGIEDPRPFTLPAAHSLQAAKRSQTSGSTWRTPRPCHGRRLTWLGGGHFCTGAAAGPHGPSGGGLRSWGNGLVGQRQVPLGVHEPWDHGRRVQPHPPEMTAADFLCWAFASAPLSVWVPSLPVHRDLEEGVVRQGGQESLWACVYVSDLYLPGQQVCRPPARPTLCSHAPDKDMGVSGDLHVPQGGHRGSLTAPTPETVISLWSPFSGLRAESVETASRRHLAPGL